MSVSVVEVSGASDEPLVWRTMFSCKISAARAVQKYVTDLHKQKILTTDYLHPVEAEEHSLILRGYCMDFIVTSHEVPS